MNACITPFPALDEGLTGVVLGESWRVEWQSKALFHCVEVPSSTRSEASMISGNYIMLVSVGLLLLSATAGAQGLPGLPEIDRRATRIRHLHLPYTFQPFLTEEHWLKRAGDLRRQIEVSAGLWPPLEKSPLKARIFGKVSKGDYSIEKVFFESYPGFFVAGNLYRPLGKKGPFPGILTPHGHWAYGRLVNQSLASMPGLAINLARQGHVVFAYDMLAYNDSRQVKDHRRPLDRSFSLWGIGWLGIQLWNSIRSVDFLQSLPDVDPGRIGCTGASGGGTQTFLLTAVDDRVKVSAPVNMISHYMQGGCICENQANLRLDTNNMEIAALMAPRPLLMVSASGDWTRETPRVEFPAVQSVYRLQGAGHKVQTMQAMADHNFNRESRESVYAWFGRWLLGESDASQFAERRFRLGSPSEVLVFFGRELPESAVTEEEMLASLKDSYRRQIDGLRPRGLRRPVPVPGAYVSGAAARLGRRLSRSRPSGGCSRFISQAGCEPGVSHRPSGPWRQGAGRSVVSKREAQESDGHAAGSPRGQGST